MSVSSSSPVTSSNAPATQEARSIPQKNHVVAVATQAITTTSASISSGSSSQVTSTVSISDATSAVPTVTSTPSFAMHFTSSQKEERFRVLQERHFPFSIMSRELIEEALEGDAYLGANEIVEKLVKTRIQNGSLVKGNTEWLKMKQIVNNISSFNFVTILDSYYECYGRNVDKALCAKCLLTLLQFEINEDYTIPETINDLDSCISECLSQVHCRSYTNAKATRFIELIVFTQSKIYPNILFTEIQKNSALRDECNFLLVNSLTQIPFARWKEKGQVIGCLLEIIGRDEKRSVASALETAPSDEPTRAVGTCLKKALQTTTSRDIYPYCHELIKLLPNLNEYDIGYIFNCFFMEFAWQKSWFKDPICAHRLIYSDYSGAFIPHDNLIIRTILHSKTSRIMLVAFDKTSHHLIWATPQPTHLKPTHLNYCGIISLDQNKRSESNVKTEAATSATAVTASSSSSSAVSASAAATTSTSIMQHILAMQYEGDSNLYCIDPKTGDTLFTVKVLKDITHITPSGFCYIRTFKNLIGGQLSAKGFSQSFEITRPTNLTGISQPAAQYLVISHKHILRQTILNKDGTFISFTNCANLIIKNNRLFTVNRETNGFSISMQEIESNATKCQVKGEKKTHLIKNYSIEQFKVLGISNNNIVIGMMSNTPCFVDIERNVLVTNDVALNDTRTNTIVVDEARATFWSLDKTDGVLKKHEAGSDREIGILEGLGQRTKLVHVDEGEQLYFM